MRILFLHGWTSNHREWLGYAEPLSDAFSTYCWDARGHGRSQPLGTSISLAICAQDMLAILDEIQESPVVLCGQSFGGYIAQHIYMLAPERVQAMIIIDSTPIAKAYSKLEVWALKVSLPLFRFWPYDHFVKTVATSTAKTPLVQEYALQAARQIERHAVHDDAEDGVEHHQAARREVHLRRVHACPPSVAEG